MMSENHEERDPTDWDSRNPLGRIEGTGRNEGNAIQFSWWNLLLLLPLSMLITPIFNSNEPALLGMPYFYWYQLAFVFVGVASVAVVFFATRNRARLTQHRQAGSAGDFDEEAGR